MKIITDVSISFIVKAVKRADFIAEAVSASIFKSEYFKTLSNNGEIQVFMPDICDSDNPDDDLYVVGFFLGGKMIEKFEKNENELVDGFKQNANKIISEHNWKLEKFMVEKTFMQTETIEY